MQAHEESSFAYDPLASLIVIYVIENNLWRLSKYAITVEYDRIYYAIVYDKKNDANLKKRIMNSQCFALLFDNASKNRFLYRM